MPWTGLPLPRGSLRVGFGLFGGICDSANSGNSTSAGLDIVSSGVCRRVARGLDDQQGVGAPGRGTGSATAQKNRLAAPGNFEIKGSVLRIVIANSESPCSIQGCNFRVCRPPFLFVVMFIFSFLGGSTFCLRKKCFCAKKKEKKDKSTGCPKKCTNRTKS